MVFLAPPQRARPENTTTYLIHTSKITCSACVGRTTPRSRLLPLLRPPPAKPARKRAAWQPVDAYRDLCFNGSPRWRSLRAGGRRSFTIERVLSSSARKVSTTAQADTQRTRGTLQHSADTTAAHQGEARRNLESLFKWAPLLARATSTRCGRPVEHRRTRIELSLDGFLVAR